MNDLDKLKDKLIKIYALVSSLETIGTPVANGYYYDKSIIENIKIELDKFRLAQFTLDKDGEFMSREYLDLYMKYSEK